MTGIAGTITAFCHSDRSPFTTRRTPRTNRNFVLIAEEVDKVNPALVLPDKEEKPYTVGYDAVNAMLLSEFLKEHKAFVAK